MATRPALHGCQSFSPYAGPVIRFLSLSEIFMLHAGSLPFPVLRNTSCSHPRQFCQINSHQYCPTKHLRALYSTSWPCNIGMMYYRKLPTSPGTCMYSELSFPQYHLLCIHLCVMPHESPYSPTFSLLIEDVPSVFKSLQTQHRNTGLHLRHLNGISTNKGCWFEARATKEQEWML